MGGVYLSQGLAGNTTLTELDLNWNAIGADVRLLACLCQHTANAINSHPRGSRTCTRSHGLWYPQGAAAIGDVLASKGCNVKTLKLAMNGLGDLGAQEIGVSMYTNRSLTSLDLAHNAIKGQGAVVLADALSRNTNLDS